MLARYVLPLIPLALIAAWALNGEMKAQAVDRAYGVSATECTTREKLERRGLGNAASIQIVSAMSGHEMLYTKIRSAILKHC